MTKAVFWETNTELGLDVSGHAGYDDTGRDIVCAACSVLAQAVGNALYSMGCGAAWTQNAGEYRLRVKKEPNALAALMVAKVGFGMLADAYPQNVTVEEREAETPVHLAFSYRSEGKTSEMLAGKPQEWEEKQ